MRLQQCELIPPEQALLAPLVDHFKEARSAESPAQSSIDRLTRAEMGPKLVALAGRMCDIP